MKDEYLKYRKDRAGDIIKVFSQFDREGLLDAQEQSQSHMMKINSAYEQDPHILSHPVLMPWVNRIKESLPNFEHGVKLQQYYQYELDGESFALTLDYYLRYIGERDDEAVFVGLAHDIDVLIALAYTIAHNLPYSHEQVVQTLLAGVRSEEYKTYASRNRELPCRKRNEVQSKDKQDRKAEVIALAEQISLSYPHLNITELLNHILAELPYELTDKTLKKYLSETDVLNRHRDSRGQKPKNR